MNTVKGIRKASASVRAPTTDYLPTLEPESPITNKGKHKYTISKKNVVAFIGDSGEVQKRATFFIS